jgi:hypothetical protein
MPVNQFIIKRSCTTLAAFLSCARISTRIRLRGQIRNLQSRPSHGFVKSTMGNRQANWQVRTKVSLFSRLNHDLARR